MRVTALQFTSRLGDIEYNYKTAAAYIKRAAPTSDVVVLPEMWNTAFYPEDVRTQADVDGRRTQDFLRELAVTYDVHIVGGSVACLRHKQVFNTTYVVNRQGKLVGTYDKAHLFTPGQEDAVFAAGSRPNIFTLDGVVMASIICYDLRFCEWVRLAALAGAQVLFVPAAWPIERVQQWQILNMARAIENQYFVVAVNTCGFVGAYQFGGHSLILDPLGQVLAQGDEREQCLQATLDLGQVADIRRRINVFNDRRPELYTLT